MMHHTPIVQTPTPKLENSIHFYESLDFTRLPHATQTLFTDGKVYLEINAARTARKGLKMYAEDWTAAVDTLSQNHPVVRLDGGYILGAPSGLWVYLMEAPSPLIEATQNVHIRKPSCWGNFSGLSVESLSLNRSARFWEVLGFETSMGGTTQGWLSLTNGSGFTLSVLQALQCPHLFETPSLTYFNGAENIHIIADIRRRKLPVLEEVTLFNKEGLVDNLVMRDPGGLGCFVFND